MANSELWQPQYRPGDTDQLHCFRVDCPGEEVPEVASSLAADLARRMTAPARAYELRPAPEAGWYVLVACEVERLGEV